MALLDFTHAPHGGRQRHLPEWQSQPKITPTTIIDHSIVGSAEGAFLLFRDRSVLESHFIVGLVGDIWQLMDTDRQADANLDANDFAISIETADLGDPDNQPWTAAQLDSLIWLHEQLLAAHPTIPRQRCPTWNGGGLGYHTLFGAPSHWTPVAKTCPGRSRKVQWSDVLLPAFLHPEEVDMPLTDADLPLLKRAVREVLGINDHLAVIQTGQIANDKALQVLVDRLTAIKVALDALAAAQHTPDELAALLAPLQVPILAPLLAAMLPAQTQPAMSGTVRLTAEPPA